MDYYEIIMNLYKSGRIEDAYNLFQRCKNEGLINQEEIDRLEEIFCFFDYYLKERSEEIEEKIKRDLDFERRIFNEARKRRLLTKNQIDEFFHE